MPNWCENRVDIYGEEKDIKAFKEKAIKDGRFEFQNLIPVPEELLSTTKGYREGLGGTWIVDKDGNEIEIPESKLKEWKDKYGATNWDVDAEIEMDPDTIRLRFATAWGPAEGIFDYIQDNFPELDVSWFYDEPGNQIAGYL
jgi:hypothetical protein